MSVIELNTANHYELLRQGIVLVEAWASWCGPCRIAGPIYEEASDRHLGVTFTSLNVDREQTLAAQHNIQSIPTVMVFRNGEKLYSRAGIHKPSELDELVAFAQGLNDAK